MAPARHFWRLESMGVDVGAAACRRWGMIEDMLRPALIATLLCPAFVCADDAFRDRVAPILQRRCLSCHNTADKKGGLSLETSAALEAGGDSGSPVAAGSPDESYLLDLITPQRGRAKMPKNADPLKA